MRIPAVLCLAVLLTSCGAQRSSASVLQRYDRLGRSLRAVSMDVRAVSRDMVRLARIMGKGNVSAVKADAGRLAADGRHLQGDARFASLGMGRLVRAERRPDIERYFTLTMTVLGWQTREGRDLTALAHLLWSDPLVTAIPDEAALRRRLGAARRDARMSVVADRLALRIRQSRARSFRYRPVHLASARAPRAENG